MSPQATARRAKLGAWGQVSVLSVVSEGRWPQEVTLTSLMSQPILSGHYTLRKTPSCLDCGLRSLDRDKEKLKWRRQVFMLQKFLCHLQQVIAPMHQKGSQSVKSTSPSRNRAGEIPGILCAPSQNTQEKSICP